mgnify:CR=1 FL=1
MILLKRRTFLKTTGLVAIPLLAHAQSSRSVRPSVSEDILPTLVLANDGLLTQTMTRRIKDPNNPWYGAVMDE